MNGNLIKGSSKFHQNHIIHWAEKEDKSLLTEGIKESIQYHNYEVFYLICENFDIINLRYKNNNTALHYGVKYNCVEIVEILLRKGANVNVKGILYQILKCYF